MGDEKDVPAEPTQVFRGLTVGQRWMAGVLGLIGTGSGGTAVFISTNQAGSTTLLLISAVFLLLGIQGTPIRRASKDSVDFAGHVVSQKVNKTLEEAGPEAANEALEKYREVVPEVSQSPEVVRAAMNIVDFANYESEARRALMRAVPDGWGVGWTEHQRSKQWDATIMDDDHRVRAFVEIKFINRKVFGGEYVKRVRDLVTSRGIVEGFITQTQAQKLPVIVMTNAVVPKYLIAELHLDNVYAVKWTGPDDDQVLDDVLNGALGPIPR